MVAEGETGRTRPDDRERFWREGGQSGERMWGRDERGVVGGSWKHKVGNGWKVETRTFVSGAILVFLMRGSLWG